MAGGDSREVDISTVLLCWNRLPLSRRCLASYRRTVSVPHELFLIDNASRDGTRAWVDAEGREPDVTGVLHSPRNDPAGALNAMLARCCGRYLHIMENDYLYRPGWDRYALDRFARLPELGQLSVSEGMPRMRRDHWRGLVHRARDNVVTSSFLRRELFFDAGVRVRGHYWNACYPDDSDLSAQVRAAGFEVAWPDTELALHLGLTDEEFRRDPGYYLRDYALKLASPARLRWALWCWARLDFRDTATLVSRFLRALAYTLGRRGVRRPRDPRGPSA